MTAQHITRHHPSTVDGHEWVTLIPDWEKAMIQHTNKIEQYPINYDSEEFKNALAQAKSEVDYIDIEYRKLTGAETTQSCPIEKRCRENMIINLAKSKLMVQHSSVHNDPTTQITPTPSFNS